MDYKYKEIVCPFCGHRHVWEQPTNKSRKRYQVKTTREIAGDAKCPKCRRVFAVLDRLVTGIPYDDPRFVVVSKTKKNERIIDHDIRYRRYSQRIFKI